MGSDTQVLTADSTQTTGLKWAAASSSSNVVTAAFSRRNGADYSLNSTTFAAVDSTNLNLTVAAATSDILELCFAARYGAETVNAFMDVATIVSGSTTNWVSGGTGNSADFGIGGWLLLSSVQGTVGGSVMYTVQAGDVSGGNVTVRLMYRTSAASAKTLRAGTSQKDALFFSVKNLKH